MIDQTILMVDRWLKDEKYGLSSMLNKVYGLCFEEPVPDAPTIYVYNEVESEELATEEGPTIRPALMVLGGIDMDWSPRNQRPATDGSVIITCLYGGPKEAPWKENSLLGGRVLRAVAKSLRIMGLLRFREEREFKIFEKIKIMDVTRITQQRIIGYIGGVSLTGAVFASFHMMDHDP